MVVSEMRGHKVSVSEGNIIIHPPSLKHNIRTLASISRSPRYA